jgi:hypothetical protein
LLLTPPAAADEARRPGLLLLLLPGLQIDAGMSPLNSSTSKRFRRFTSTCRNNSFPWNRFNME